MGMYTELQGTIKFKTEQISEAFINGWEEVSDKVSLCKEFVNYSRSSSIPNSGDGVILQEGKIVQFHCDLKNYESTIEAFIKLLPELADSWCLESRYEENSQWTLHRNNKEDVYVNGSNQGEIDYTWPRHIELIEHPKFDVFDINNLD